MHIQFANRTVPFEPWSPDMGTVFDQAIAIDVETTPIDHERPERIPHYVIGAASDGQRGYWIERQDVAAFLSTHQGLSLVFHNAPFDLAVLHRVAPAAAIYDAVDQNRVWDTRLLHQLLVLGESGETASGPGESTLARCAEIYLGVSLPKETVGSDGEEIRLSFGRWFKRPWTEIPEDSLGYLGRDVVATLGVCGAIAQRLDQLCVTARDAFGFVSSEWLNQQWNRRGPQTHHTQLKAAIVLDQITRNGLTIDPGQVDQVLTELTTKREELLTQLRVDGFLPGPGANQTLQTILATLARRSPDQEWPRTATGQFATSLEAISQIANPPPFLQAYQQFRTVESLLTLFGTRLQRRVAHPRFRVLMRTGRTSSFGDLNAQNLPRDSRIRRCIVPSPGHRFVGADYHAIELVTLAQALRSQFGVEHGGLEQVLREGIDPHRLVAAAVTRQEIGVVSPDDRQRAKAINFGKPGGMGRRALQDYARATYQVELDDVVAAQFEEVWFSQFPEMRGFLESGIPNGLGVARRLGLTPHSHAEQTGDGRFLNHPENVNRTDHPLAILGSMCLKVLGDESPTTGAGVPYSSADLEYFWTAAQDLCAELPDRLAGDLAARRPSVALKLEARRLCDRGGVITATGRLRANASYTARHNTLFQGLASDGAKLALWKLWRGGHRIVNFIHDEVLVEVPEDADAAAVLADVERLLIAGMQEVVPDLPIRVDARGMTAWTKEVETTAPISAAPVREP